MTWICSTGSADEVARQVSYVPQAHAAFFPFTVREVVLMGRTAHLAIFSSPSRRDREIAQTAIERMRLAHLADSIYTRISGGERQLTLIARALAQDARIVVMDEPTANLDFGNQVRVLRAHSGAGAVRHRRAAVDARSRPGVRVRRPRGDAARGQVSPGRAAG